MTITYPIKTERLHLRPFEITDLEDVYAYYQRAEVFPYLYTYEKNRAETEVELRKWMQAADLTKKDQRLALAVVLPATQTVIADLHLIARSPEHKQAELGYIINPDFGGKGYATEAARAVLALGFSEFGFHRIFGRCDARNTASYKLMARLGMRQEAHFVHNEIFKGEWGDELYYAILEDEWRVQKNESNAD